MVAELRLSRVVQRFGELTALDGLDLEVARGEVVGLLGHNGAGKTTTVRVVAGLLAPAEGRVEVLGADPLRRGSDVRQQLGVLPSRPVVDDRLTAIQNLRFAGAVFGMDTAVTLARAGELLERFGLTERAGERVGTFSTGMRQRLSLARVLMSDPRLLLLDEPTANLDPLAARQVRSILLDLARDAARTVVLCTHDLAEAEVLCDRVVVLAQGREIASGRPADLAAAHGGGGLVVQVGRGQVPEVLSCIDNLPADLGASAGAIDEERVRVAPAPGELAPLLVRALVAAGIDVHELHREVASLEDVYLALHGAVPHEEDTA